VEYQGPVVRVAVTTDDGLDAVAVVSDRDFYRSPVGPGDVTVLSWPEDEAHKLAH
jgi:TOBE domain